MKYLNLGCGYHYSMEPEWTNLDFVSTGLGVIAHNLLNGIPFTNEHFDLVYHSHVLEHFSKADGEKLIAECFRVLKPGGVIRIAVPDLETITRNYLHYLEAGIENPDDEMAALNYEWTLLEMYDQTVRNVAGGDIANYLSQETIKNEDFVYERIGEEAKSLRRNYWETKENKSGKELSYKAKPTSSIPVAKLKRKIKEYLLKRLAIDREALETAKFRLSGEVHQWMYDRFSLATLLKNKGGKNIERKDAFTSNLTNWINYGLDNTGDIVRKPDSLFMEAVK
jgi:predicted SAM-dependent methyltransferase